MIHWLRGPLITAAAGLALAGQRGPALPSAMQLEESRALFTEARAALPELPDPVQAVYLSRIATAEQGHFPDEADADRLRAFHQAQALPVPAAGANAKQLIAFVKHTVEGETIQALGRNHFEAALELVRGADIPHGALYDALLETAPTLSTVNIAPAGDPPQLVERGEPPFDLMAMVMECRNAGGGFPYAGVTRILNATAPEYPDRTALLRAGFQAAAEETDPARLRAALQFLQFGHQLALSWDPVIEDAAQSLLKQIASGFPPDPRSRPTALNLITLIEQIDPSQAPTLSEQYAGLSPPIAAEPARAAAPLDRDAPVNVGAGPSAAAPRAPLAVTRQTIDLAFTQAQEQAIAKLQAQVGSTADDLERFQLLVRLTAAEMPRHGGEAARDATRAFDLATRDNVEQDPDAACHLALYLHQLGQPAAAAGLIERSLDALEDNEVRSDEKLREAGDEDRAQMEIVLAGRNSLPEVIFPLAATLDRGLALRRARQFRGRVAKPLILAAIAVP